MRTRQSGYISYSFKRNISTVARCSLFVCIFMYRAEVLCVFSMEQTGHLLVLFVIKLLVRCSNQIFLLSRTKKFYKKMRLHWKLSNCVCFASNIIFRYNKTESFFWLLVFECKFTGSGCFSGTFRKKCVTPYLQRQDNVNVYFPLQAWYDFMHMWTCYQCAVHLSVSSVF